MNTAPRVRADADVAVIGAGVAGLAAAAALQKAGYAVVVVEARPRLGGRLWTNRDLNGLPLDLGASWIHGTRGNPLTTLAREYGLATKPTDYDTLLAYDRDGTPVDDRRHQALDARLDALLEATAQQREARQRAREPDISLQQALETAQTGQRLDARARRELAYALNTTIEHEYAADAAELSLFYYADSEVFDGGDRLLPGGYGQIAEGLARGLTLELGREVRRVVYGGDSVRLVTSKGELQARHAVITLPLGVLKAGGVTFDPLLPQRKQQAITRLGSGLLNKLYLRFPRVFWERDSELLGLIGERKGEWAEWLNLAFYLDQPVLLAFNAGSYGRALEPMSDQALVAAALNALRVMYGRAVVAPTGYLLTRWATDPYARGSYSFVAPGATPADREALAEPVASRLFFAGEHTSVDYPSTVHGALLSGRHAAAMIMGL